MSEAEIPTSSVGTVSVVDVGEGAGDWKRRKEAVCSEN